MPQARPTALAVMALILLATVVDGLDASIVNILLPTMSQDLGMSVAGSAFVSVAYLIPISGLCLAFSKFADRTDVRRMFAVGIIIFTVASALCAASMTASVLIASRFVQGLGATLMVAATPILVVRGLPEDHRARGMACISTGTAISVMAGPIVGGIIGDLASWHWAFLINIPLGIILLAATYTVLPGGRHATRSDVPDIPATVMMFAGIAMAISGAYGYVEEYLEGAWAAVVCVVGGALVALSFYRSARSDNPLISPSVFEDRRFVTVTAVFLLSTMIAAGVIYLLPYYLQLAQGLDSTMSGLVLAAAYLMTLIFAPITGRWCDARGCKTPGAVTLALRLVFSVMMVFMVPELGFAFLMITVMIAGVSFGISGTALSTRMMEVTDDAHAGEAGSMAMTVNYVGSALGLASYALVFSIMGSGAVGEGDLGGFLDGFHGACAFGAVLSATALVAHLLVRDRRVPAES